jgi:hypothetical protein
MLPATDRQKILRYTSHRIGVHSALERSDTMTGDRLGYYACFITVYTVWIGPLELRCLTIAPPTGTPPPHPPPWPKRGCLWLLLLAQPCALHSRGRPSRSPLMIDFHLSTILLISYIASSASSDGSRIHRTNHNQP